MRTRPTTTVAIAAACLLALGACVGEEVTTGPDQPSTDEPTTDEPSPDGGGPQPSSLDVVGEAIASWSQADAADGAGLPPDVEAVLTTDEALQQWLDDLPADTGMRETFEVPGTDLEDNVYAVMQYPECGNTVQPVTDGSGAIAELETTVEDVDCEWAPERIILFEISRADLGEVEDEDIRRDDSILGGADGDDDGSGTAGGSGDEDDDGSLSDVGEHLAAWVQTAGTDVSDVARDGVFATQEDLDEWLAGQPADLGVADALDEPIDLEDSVAVVLAFGSCGNQVVPVTDGAGAVAGDVRTVETIECAWAPLTLVLFEVGLDELGVDDPADVRLDPSIVE